MSLHSASIDRRIRATFAAALILAVFSPSLAVGDSPSSPFTGLELIPSKNVGALYRRPDVDISAYSKIMIGEPAVEFSKNWNPRNYGTFGLSAGQLTKIRVDLAAMAKSVFAKTLNRRHVKKGIQHEIQPELRAPYLGALTRGEFLRLTRWDLQIQRPT